MSTLLIRNISQLVTCDDGDRVLQNADIYCEDGFIKSIGTALDVTADEVIDAMAEVGNAMSHELRETGIGGLAGTPTGCRIRDAVTRGFDTP